MDISCFSLDPSSLCSLPVDALLPLAGRMPLLDVRSPGEFYQGHIPGAVSFPLFDDEERAQVGTLFKQRGRDAAFAHGLSLVGPKTAGFLAEAARLCARLPHREIALYCWRGGERSAAVAQFLGANGFTVYRLEGGYKKFRHFVLDAFTQPWRFIVVGGKTGSGKTAVLHALRDMGNQTVDLEGMARHRGSAFGALPEEQPRSEHFENRLAHVLWGLDAARPIWVEEESEKLGRVRLPQAFFAQMRLAPAVLLETAHEARLLRILDEYAGLSHEHLAESIRKIERRLGNERCREALSLLESGNRRALVSLLLEYYDKGYSYQIQQRTYGATVPFTTVFDTARHLAALEADGGPLAGPGGEPC